MDPMGFPPVMMAGAALLVPDLCVTFPMKRSFDLSATVNKQVAADEDLTSIHLGN